MWRKKKRGDRKDSEQEEISKEVTSIWGTEDESESTMQWWEDILSLLEGGGQRKRRREARATVRH